jgi:hypothetical protein
VIRQGGVDPCLVLRRSWLFQPSRMVNWPLSSAQGVTKDFGAVPMAFGRAAQLSTLVCACQSHKSMGHSQGRAEKPQRPCRGLTTNNSTFLILFTFSPHTRTTEVKNPILNRKSKANRDVGLRNNFSSTGSFSCRC